MALTGMARVLKGYQPAGLAVLNLKTAAATITIVPAESGKLFIPRAAFFRFVLRSGADGTVPQIKISCGGVDLVAATTLGFAGTAVQDLITLPLRPADGGATNHLKAYDLSSAIIATVVVASGWATLDSGIPVLEGYKI